MKISLIIATYNRPDMLELVLLSVAQQLVGPSLRRAEVEVIIADDGSKDATRQLIQAMQVNFPFKLIHIWHEDQGFRLAAIRNLAVSSDQGDYLLFIDGDCLLANDYLQNQLALAETGYFVAGNRVLLSPAYTQAILQSKDIAIASRSILKGLWAKLCGRSNKFLAALRLNPAAGWRKKQATNWRRPKGCNIGVARSDYLLVNGFDEEFIGWGHEDADFFIRLLHNNIRIKDGRFAVPVYHLWHATNDRSNEAENMARLLSRVNNPTLKRAGSGVDKYLPN